MVDPYEAKLRKEWCLGKLLYLKSAMTPKQTELIRKLIELEGTPYYWGESDDFKDITVKELQQKCFNCCYYDSYSVYYRDVK